RATPEERPARRGGADARDPRRQAAHPREAPRANQELVGKGRVIRRGTPRAARGYSGRQVLGKATHAALRVGSEPKNRGGSFLWASPRVHSHGEPTGAAAAFMMRPTTMRSASTS